MKPWPFVSSLSNAHVLGPEAQEARDRVLLERLIQKCRRGVFRRLLSDSSYGPVLPEETPPGWYGFIPAPEQTP